MALLNLALQTIRASGRMLSNLRIVDQRKLYLLWEENHLQRVFAHCDVDCVFDIGANYGQYASMLRHKLGFKGFIISFGPLPDAAAALRKKSARDPNWIIEELAVSRSDGKRSFNIMSDSQFSSLSTPRHDEVDLFRYKNSVKKAVLVKTETLATAYHRLEQRFHFKAPFLKMDTQGFDVEIVSHARSIVRNFVGLQSELAIKKLYQDAVDFRQAISIYEKCGFEMSAFIPNNFGHFPRLVETDCIMVRSDLMAIRRKKNITSL